MQIGLYIHLPFCLSKCDYCDFVSYTGRESLMADYVKGLAEEYHLYRDIVSQATIGTVYLGGGTPSLLSSDLIAAVLAIPMSDLGRGQVEITMEANPGTLDEDKLAAFLAHGGTRLSLGVQSHDDAVLRELGRAHTAEEARSAAVQARKSGVSRINLDLIYGLPGQTLQGWRRTLEFALSLAPDHLSLYSLELHPGTPMAQRVSAGLLTLPDEDLGRGMMESAGEILTADGFLRYELASYARPGAECLHNLNYWRNGSYLGLGAAAHSRWHGKRWFNHADPESYLAAVHQGVRPVHGTETLGAREDLLETVMLGIRLREGLDLEVFPRRFGQTASELFLGGLEALSADGLLETAGTRLRLTEEGVYLADYTLRKLVRGILERVPDRQAT